jgi:hypothetical protein
MAPANVERPSRCAIITAKGRQHLAVCCRQQRPAALGVMFRSCFKDAFSNHVAKIAVSPAIVRCAASSEGLTGTRRRACGIRSHHAIMLAAQMSVFSSCFQDGGKCEVVETSPQQQRNDVTQGRCVGVTSCKCMQVGQQTSKDREIIRGSSHLSSRCSRMHIFPSIPATHCVGPLNRKHRGLARVVPAEHCTLDDTHRTDMRNLLPRNNENVFRRLS